METKYFSLGQTENNKLVKIIKIVFGIVCIIIALFWIKFNITSLNTAGSFWITIIFLTGFGLYQIWSGLGRAARFIELGTDNIRLKKSAIMPAVNMTATEIERIEIFPLNVVFFLASKKRVLLRFGTTFYDQNVIILDEIIGFAESNDIPYEVIEEKLEY